MDTNNNIKLLTWMATNRDPRFLENVVDALERETGKKVSTVYYLCGGKEREQKEIQEILANVKAFFGKTLEIVPIHAGTFNHSSLNEVMEHAMRALEPMLGTMGDICINISSGTPTMSIVWMFLKSLNFFRGRATYYDAPKYQPSIHRSNDVVPKGKQEIYLFDFDNANTVMSNIRAANRKLQSTGLKDTFLGANSRVALRREAFERIKQFSKIDNVPMLILGERGVGKSAAVKYLIKEFKGKEVFEAPCGALDSNLAESMLFGHKKGSFTGAYADQEGLFERADKNILFLDEIQDLPRTTQRKLLRTIQEKNHPYTPLGAKEEKHANVQLIFASNNTMEQLYEKLDPDFFDRIKMFMVRLPALRDCGADIQDDWNAVWQSCVPQGRQKNLKAIPTEAPWNDELEEYFKNPYNLEGNIRSLQKVAYQIIAWEAWDIPQKISAILKELGQENMEAHDCLQKIARKNKGTEVAALESAALEGATQDGTALPFERECRELGLEYNWENLEDIFKKTLIESAEKKWGSRAVAAEKLGCNPSTISKFFKKLKDKGMIGS